MNSERNKMEQINYDECAYPVPPVCTAYWNVSDWERYADWNCVNPKHDHKQKESKSETNKNDS